MPAAWEQGNAAREPEETTNPFAPPDYTSRLKAVTRRAEHAVKPPYTPGQPYGAPSWMSPPKPFDDAAPQPSVPLWNETLPASPPAPDDSAPFFSTLPPLAPPGMLSYEPDSAAEAPLAPPAPPTETIPSYLQKRPAIKHEAMSVPSSEPAAAPPVSATIPSYLQKRPHAAAQVSGNASEASAKARRRRSERHSNESMPAKEQLPPAAPFNPYDTMSSVPQEPVSNVSGDASGVSYASLFGNLPTWSPPAATAAPAEPEAFVSPDSSVPFFSPADDFASYVSAQNTPQPESSPPAEVGLHAEQSPTEERPLSSNSPYLPCHTPAPSAPAAPQALPLRDPFMPAKAKDDTHARMKAQPHATAPASTAAPAKPPIRIWRVVALFAVAAMLLLCGVVGGSLIAKLAANEREMAEVRAEYRQRMGIDLQRDASRVELLPAGQTYTPTQTPEPVKVAATPVPTPIIPINEPAAASLNKRETSSEAPQEAAPSPVARTREIAYPKNEMRNIMPGLIDLRAENADVVGRLVIDGVLDEVVVQRNNTYYLTHNYRGSNSSAGAVFADESCTLQKPPENLLLRGQSASPGKVFAPLWQFVNGGRDFVAANTYATLTTLYEEERYVLFAVIQAASDPASAGYFSYASHPTFTTDDAMLAYVQQAREHSLYQFNVEVLASDRLLTLATIGGDSCLVLLYKMVR